MRFKELRERLTGISCPIFGVSWNPGPSEIAAARRVIAFLEDRRVLYVPHELEVPRHCVDSVLEIRRQLTAEIGALPDAEGVVVHLRAMRAACRKLLDTTQRETPEILDFGGTPGHLSSWIFQTAVGELRAVFGIHIAQLAARHGLDIEDDLAVIVPAAPADDDDRPDGRGRR